MASNPGAGFEVALNNQYMFNNAQQYDFLIRTTGRTQRILFGYSNANANAALAVVSSNVAVYGGLGVNTSNPDGIIQVNTNTLPVNLGPQPSDVALGSAFTSYNKQLALRGDWNTGYNTGNSIKLYIGHYDNENTTNNVYPILCEDENAQTDFFVRARDTQLGNPTMYFAGNVGVGTTTPAYKMDIIDATPVLRIGTASTTLGRIMLGNSGHGIARGANISTALDTNDVIVHTAGSGNVVLCTQLTERFRVGSNGCIGINSSNPTKTLEVIDTNPTIQLHDPGADGNCIIEMREFTKTTTAYGFDVAYIGNTDNKFIIRSYNNSLTPVNSLVIDRGTNKVGLRANSNPLAMLSIGNSFTTNNGITIDMQGDTASPFVARKNANLPAFGILPWDSQTFLHHGCYYEGGNWKQHNNNSNAMLLTLTSAGGTSWFANAGASNSSNITSWNIASSVQLWDNSANWTSLIQSTRAGDSYFTGGDVGIGTNAPQAKLDVRGGIYIGTNTGRMYINGIKAEQSNYNWNASYIGQNLDYDTPSSNFIIKSDSANAGASGTIYTFSSVRFFTSSLLSRTTDCNVPFDTFGNTFTRMIITANGDVGIGSNLTPGTKLDVDGGVECMFQMGRSNYATTLAAATWHEIGTFAGVAGNRLELKLLGANSYGNTLRNNGGATTIYATLNNNDSTTVANINGSFTSTGDAPAVTDVKFVQNSTNRYSYRVLANVANYAAFAIFPLVSTGASFTQAVVSTTDPGANSATVQQAYASMFVVNGNMALGAVAPLAQAHLTNDMFIAANSAAWNTTAGKGLFMRYSTNGAQDSAYIQSITRSSTTYQNLGIEASNIYIGGSNSGATDSFAALTVRYNANVGIGIKAANYPLHIHRPSNFTGLKFTNDFNSNIFLDVGFNTQWHFIYGYGDHPMSFATNGTERIRILGAGNVAIGSNTAVSKLDVNGEITARSAVNAQSVASGTRAWFAADNGVDAGWSLGLDTDNTFRIKGGYAGGNGFATASNRIAITNSGFMGIGISNPSYTLDTGASSGTVRFAKVMGVSETGSANHSIRVIAPSTSNTLIQFGDFVPGACNLSIVSPVGVAGNWSTGTVVGDTVMRASTGNFHLGTGGGTRVANLVLDTAGNVGVGTVAPGFTFDCIGSGAFGATAATRVVATDREVKWIGNGLRHYSIFNSNNLFTLRDTSANAALGTAGNVILTVQGTSSNVGIGPNAPDAAYRLDVQGNAAFSNAFVGDCGYGANFATFTHKSTASAGNYALLADNTGNTFVNAATGKTIFFRENNANKMALLGGNLGINTTAPSYRLHVEDGSAFIGLVANATTGSTTYSGDRLVFDCTYNGVPGTGTAANKILLHNVSSWVAGFGIEGNAVTYHSGCNHTFYTVATQASYGTARMRLDGGGNLICTGDVSAFGTISDCNLKTNVHGLSNCLDIISQLRPVEFEWKGDIFQEDKRGKADVGFLAQEVEPHIPLAVGSYEQLNTSNVYKNLKHERILPYLVGAIQELRNKLEVKDQQIADLQKQIDELKK